MQATIYNWLLMIQNNCGQDHHCQVGFSFLLTNSHVQVQMSQGRYIAMMEVTHIVTIHDALCIAPTMHEEVHIWQVNGTLPYLQHPCLYTLFH